MASKDPTFVTGLDGAEEQKEEKPYFEDDDNEESEESGEEDDSKNLYVMAEAEPPTNYEDAYSTLPGKIKLSTVRKDILESIKFKQEIKDADLHNSSIEESQ
jgi:hypothetical protein